MAYATSTKVPVVQTQAEIGEMLRKAGATTYGTANEGDRGIVFFRLKDRMVRFTLKTGGGAQGERTRWRTLLLVLKAKLEAIATGLVTLEDEFLAQTMTGDGKTVSEHVQPIIEKNLIEGGAPRFALLGAPEPKP